LSLNVIFWLHAVD